MTAQPRAWSHALALGVLAAGIGAVYANSFGTDLVFDSRVLVLENPAIRQLTPETLRFMLTRDYWQPVASDGLYRPVATLTYAFNYAVLGNGGRPFGYHALNLLLHLGCVSLLYALVWQMVRRPWAALGAAALFGVHPVTTEAVTNVAGRPDLLAALGILGALFCHARAGTDGEQRRAHWSFGVLVAAMLAFFSKENGLALVVLLFTYDLIFQPRGAPSRRWRDHVVVWCALGAYLAARWYVASIGPPVEDHSPIDNPLVEATSWSGWMTALEVLGRQLWLLLCPATLSADYSYRQIPIATSFLRAASDWRALMGWFALGALAAAAFRLRRSEPTPWFFVLFAIVALLPTANLVVVIGSIMAERFLYLPLVGVAAALALLVDRAAARTAGRGAVLAAAAVILVACGWRTRARNHDWADELHLWSSAVRAAPESAKAHKAYAAALYAADPRRLEIDRAIAEVERALEIRPDYLGALIDLGAYYVVKGDLLAARSADATEARVWYARSIDVLDRARALDERVSRRYVEKMVARGRDPTTLPDTGNLELFNNLSLAYLGAGRLEDALAAYEQSRRLDPTNPAHYIDASAVLCRLGRWEDAAVALFQAVTIAPDNREAAARLVEVYRTFLPGGHAVVIHPPDQARIDLDDPVVHRHRCQAHLGLAEIYARAKLADAAARVRARGAQVCRQHDAAAGRGYFVAGALSASTSAISDCTSRARRIPSARRSASEARVISRAAAVH